MQADLGPRSQLKSWQTHALRVSMRPMVGVGRVVALQAGQEGRVGKAFLDHRVQGRMISLQPQQVIAAPRPNRAGGFLLAVDGIGGYQMPLQVQAFQQGASGQDFAVAFRHPVAVLAHDQA